jgi:thiamine-phosphate pyrophosphorylase
LAAARLHAIVDLDASARAGRTPIDVARAFLDGGAPLIQLRAKRVPSSAFLALADACLRLVAPYGAAVVINDRVDVAQLSQATGVHVGQDDLPPSAARLLLGPEAIVGLSTHSLRQVQLAANEAVSYIAVGPIFGTRTKDTGYDAVGLELVSAAAACAQGRPVVAIGGVTLERAPSVIAAGASAVAVIGDLLATGNPSVRVREYLRALAV